MSDPNFHVWRGNVEVIPVDVATKTGENKLQTCKHRSPEKHTRMQHNCCSSWPVEGFLCLKKAVFNIQAQDCENCKLYEQNIQKRPN